MKKLAFAVLLAILHRSELGQAQLFVEHHLGCPVEQNIRIEASYGDQFGNLLVRIKPEAQFGKHILFWGDQKQLYQLALKQVTQIWSHYFIANIFAIYEDWRSSSGGYVEGLTSFRLSPFEPLKKWVVHFKKQDYTQDRDLEGAINNRETPIVLLPDCQKPLYYFRHPRENFLIYITGSVFSQGTWPRVYQGLPGQMTQLPLRDYLEFSNGNRLIELEGGEFIQIDRSPQSSQAFYQSRSGERRALESFNATQTRPADLGINETRIDFRLHPTPTDTYIAHLKPKHHELCVDYLSFKPQRIDNPLVQYR